MVDVVYKGLFDQDGKNVDIPKNRLSWDHLCLYYGARITVYDVRTSAGTTTLYTCPAGKVFLLIFAEMASKNDDLGNNSLSLRSGTDSVDILTQYYSAARTTQNVTFTPSVPLRLLDKESLTLTTGAFVDVQCSLYGYEIDASIFYRES